MQAGLLGMGPDTARRATERLLDTETFDHVMVVGIAGGLPSDDISLGDVVLSTRVLDFSVEARKFQEHTTYNVGGGPQAHHHGSDVGVRCGYSRASCAARPVISRRASTIVTPDLRRANTRR